MSSLDVISARAFVLRIVTCEDAGRAGEEIRVTNGVATIGRDESCTVVLSEPTVSRRHARVERTAHGFEVTDLGSSNGVWVGNERVTRRLLEEGQQFRIGSAVFECRAADEAREQRDRTEAKISTGRGEAVAAPAAEPSEGFVIRIVACGADSVAGRTVRVAGSSAVIGRSAECTVVLNDREISRKHAKIDMVPHGFRLVDLGSTNGTWVDDRRITGAVVLTGGQRLRLGKSTILECHRSEEEAEAPRPAHAEMTVVMPTPVELLGKTTWLDEEGELVEASPTKPFLLDDPDSVWYLVTGAVDIFTVSIEGGKPAGTRTHFLGILPGQCFFGFDLHSHGMGRGFLAVGRSGTKLRRIPLGRLEELAADRRFAAAVAGLIDTWVAGLSKSLTRDIPRPGLGPAVLKPGESTSLTKQQRATSQESVVWVDVWSGSHLFVDMAVPVFAGKRVFLPVTPDSWIQPIGDEFADTSFTPRPTHDVAANPALWQGLRVFHQVICECEFINKKLATVDEFIRLQQKAEYTEAAKEAAYDAIGSVLRTEAATPKEFLEAGSLEPVFEACKLVGDALGIEVKNHPEADESLTYEEKVSAIASASGFRTRVVALKGHWWEGDHGPLLGQLEESKSAVAILPTGPGSYVCVDPRTGSRTPVDDRVAASLSGFGYAFYRPFPEGPLGPLDLVRFGARGLARDFRTVLIMAVVVGVLGTVTPLVTGWIFDSAIPEADRAMLFGYGAALLAAAIATPLFKFTQSVAMLRVQGRMESGIQSALWDRLLGLPVNFFRNFAAGDLADRVAGIDAIQTLVSGAGVSAILGSVSGVFYVGVLFLYDSRLAFWAVVLTAVYVGVTTLANYLQLTYQRQEIMMQGRITGLVLNLITGVTKLRVAGAEHHAFREWAQQFSRQRRIRFTVGRIQNSVTVFSNVFPVLSSMVIFYVMLSAQQEAAQTGQAMLTTGEFIAFNAAFGLFLGAMQSLGDASMNLLRVVPIYERLKPIVVSTPEVDSSKAYPGKLEGAIELSHVYFRYHDDGPWIIKDLSLKIEPGEFVAVVGSSGCGKSTLMRLMLGFEKPTMGSIYYDGQELGSLDLRMLRQQIGVVLQQSRVLPTDIYRNIVGTSSRSIEDAWEAAEMAGLAEDIRLMPMQMHTYVSEGGGTLSGGQRQRLLIARAIVNKPKIIFLDEATSALDNRAQAKVTESMERLKATRIVIAHRLSTIINADKICYLENGRIAEMGTYQELMEKDGLFAQLAKRQVA